MQKEQPGADGAEAEILVTDVLPGPLEEYAPDSIFIMLCDISCLGEVRRYMMTFTTASHYQRRGSAAAPLPVNTFSPATQWQRDHKEREGPLEKACTSKLGCWLVRLGNALLTNTFSTGQDTANNGGTHGYLTRIENETKVHTCRKRALLFHMRLCKVGFTFLESQDLVYLSTPSLVNSVNALRNG